MPRIFFRMNRFDYDVAVLGGGSAGYAAARTAAGAGLKTVVIEGGEEVGGLCILRGCMPTKTLLYAAEVMRLASHPEPWGIRAGKTGFDFKKVMARKNALIKDFADYRVQHSTAGNSSSSVPMHDLWMPMQLSCIHKFGVPALAGPNRLKAELRADALKNSPPHISSLPPAQTSRHRPCPRFAKPATLPATTRWR